jgi:hypothetical protein
MTSFPKRFLSLSLVVFLASATPVVATDPPAAKTSASQTQLERQLLEQQSRLTELEKLVRQQQTLVELLNERLAALAEGAAPAPSSASAGAPAMQSDSAQVELERVSGEMDALAESTHALQQKVAQVEKKTNDNEKSLSAKLKGLGNFSFSGDVRVRYEPFFGGTLSNDRHRERFRLRFNALAQFSDELAGGLTLASGDLNDPISTNQTLTTFFERKPVAIDRAFLQYKPKAIKPLTLTGGKFSYTWYRTELTFDNDLNPEGFSQSLNFEFRNPVFQRITLVGFQLPFREISNFDDSFLHGGQVQTYWKLGERVRFSGYAGFYNWHRADPIRSAQGSGTLAGSTNSNAATASQYASKFALLNLLARADLDTGWARWPLLVQLDFVTNTRACGNLDEISGAPPACNSRDRQGYWAEAQVGRSQEKGDLQFGYTFIRLEREAVLAAFNFSDLRQPTNVVNHRLNFGYQAYKSVNLGFTALLGRALRTATSPDEEPWLKRLQFDVLYKF